MTETKKKWIIYKKGWMDGWNKSGMKEKMRKKERNIKV